MRGAHEIAVLFDRPLVLRFFPSKRSGGEPSALAWRASFSGHYYTSDSCRPSLFDSDDRDGMEGWGATPDEAAARLIDNISKRKQEMVGIGRDRLNEYIADAREFEAKING